MLTQIQDVVNLPERGGGFYQITTVGGQTTITNEDTGVEEISLTGDLNIAAQSNFFGWLFNAELGPNDQAQYPEITTFTFDAGDDNNEINFQAVNFGVVTVNGDQNRLTDNSGLINQLVVGGRTNLFELNEVVNFTHLGEGTQVITQSMLDGLIGGENLELTVTGSDNGIFSFMPDAENATINAGNGEFDIAAFAGDQSAWEITMGNTVTVSQHDSDNVHTFSGVEIIRHNSGDLANGELYLPAFSGLGQLTQPELESFVELYIAYYNRAPDALGLSFWGTAFANGTTLEEAAGLFIEQNETAMLYPSTLTNAEFAAEVYANVLGRQPDQAGFDFWVGVLDSGAQARDQFILAVLEGAKATPAADATPEFIAQQQADQAYLANKTAVGIDFAIVHGLSDVEVAATVMGLFDGSAASVDAALAATDAADDGTQMQLFHDAFTDGMFSF